MFTETFVSKEKVSLPKHNAVRMGLPGAKHTLYMVQWSHVLLRASLCATHKDKSLSVTRRSQYYNPHRLLHFPKSSKRKQIPPFPVVPWELIGQASGGQSRKRHLGLTHPWISVYPADFSKLAPWWNSHRDFILHINAFPTAFLLCSSFTKQSLEVTFRVSIHLKCNKLKVWLYISKNIIPNKFKLNL